MFRPSPAEYRNALRLFPVIRDVARKARMPEDSDLGRMLPWILLGIGSRETGWGTNRLYVDVDGVEDDDIGDGTGDHGHGRGLMQIDDRWHKEFIASGRWKIPANNIEHAAGVLRTYYVYLRRKGLADPVLSRATVSAYNAGPGGVMYHILQGSDADQATTGRDYCRDVWGRASWYKVRIEAIYGHGGAAIVLPRPVEHIDGIDLLRVRRLT